jgi:hypothetical protein
VEEARRAREEEQKKMREAEEAAAAEERRLKEEARAKELEELRVRGLGKGPVAAMEGGGRSGR